MLRRAANGAPFGSDFAEQRCAIISKVRRRRQECTSLASCSPPRGAAANCRYRRAISN